MTSVARPPANFSRTQRVWSASCSPRRSRQAPYRAHDQPASGHLRTFGSRGLQQLSEGPRARARLEGTLRVPPSPHLTPDAAPGAHWRRGAGPRARRGTLRARSAGPQEAGAAGTFQQLSQPSRRQNFQFIEQLSPPVLFSEPPVRSWSLRKKAVLPPVRLLRAPSRVPSATLEASRGGEPGPGGVGIFRENSPVSACAPPGMPRGRPFRCLYSALRRQWDVLFMEQQRHLGRRERHTQAAVFPNRSHQERNPTPSALLPFPEPGRLRLFLAATQGPPGSSLFPIY
nr:uncharacterized protein LOC123572498 [Macaca fascicularis]